MTGDGEEGSGQNGYVKDTQRRESLLLLPLLLVMT
jgi:hypothetical protein